MAEKTTATGQFDVNDDAVVELFSEYYEGSLSENKSTEFTERLAADDKFAAAYKQFEKTMELLSGMHKMSAPLDFEKKVEDTIHRRSGGRFFGRKAFGERIPYEILAVLVMLIAGAIYWMGQTSGTGGHRIDDSKIPEMHKNP